MNILRQAGGWPCKQSSSPAMLVTINTSSGFDRLLAILWCGSLWTHHSSLSSPPRSGLRKKTAITAQWKCHELYFKRESKATAAKSHWSTRSLVQGSDNWHHITLYSYRMPFFPLLLLWADTNCYLIPVLILWHEERGFKIESPFSDFRDSLRLSIYLKSTH